MTTPVWDPDQYLRHAGHRGRPLTDLLARVPELPEPHGPRIADLGCGPGGPTAPLAARWPGAHVTGYDNSAAMLDEARAHAGPTGEGGSVDFAYADLTTWRPGPGGTTRTEGSGGETFDLIFSNAALQWVPGHTASFAAWTGALTPGGTFAFQVPGNFTSPSHTLLHELRNSPRWRDRLGAPSRDGDVLDPPGYLALLTGLGCEVDAWETTYAHVLRGEDAVLDWVKGTALRPVLTLLDGDPEARDAFLEEYREALRAAYPPLPGGSGDGTPRTVFPFRRVFVVAVKR